MVGLILKNRRSGVAKASLVLLVIIIVSIAGVGGYGGYEYMKTHNITFGSSGNVSTTNVSASTASSQTTVASTFSFSQQSFSTNSATPVPPGSSTVVFFASSTSSSSAATESLTQTESTVSSLTTATFAASTSTTSSSSQNWPFILTYPPSIAVNGGVTYLNASYTNSLAQNAQVYLNATLFSNGIGSPVGSVLQSVKPGYSLSMYVKVGDLAAGSYSVTFYIAEYPSGTQVSGSTTINFNI